MSLSVAGVWAAGVWNTTTWAADVWREGAATVVIPPKTGGRSKKKRRYSVELDGQYFVFASIAEVEAFLAQVRETVEEQADAIATPVVKKPPRVAIKTAAGKPTTSKTLKAAVKRTQKVINRAYVEAAKRREVDAEISRLLTNKLNHEDEEDALLVLLL